MKVHYRTIADVQKLTDILKHATKNITNSQIINKPMPMQVDTYLDINIDPHALSLMSVWLLST